MNFQTTIGTLLISSAIALTSMVLSSAFKSTPESLDQPSIATGFKEAPLRLSPIGPRADLNQPVVAMKQMPPLLHPPLVGPKSVPADSAPAPVLKISDHAYVNQVNPLQVNRIQNDPVHDQSGYELPERANLIPQAQLPVLNEDPNTAPLAPRTRVSQLPALNQPRHSVSQDRQEVKSRLEEHYSTDQPKYVQNRYVTSDGQPTLAARVLALERNSLTRDTAEASRDEQRQDPTSVRQASYESKGIGTASSVLINETIPLELEVGSAFDPAMQQAAAPQQIAPANGATGMSMQQPVLQRLRVNPRVEARAREHIEYGESLARRNSYLAAREEFTLALLLIARSHKSQSDPDAYSNRLAQGLTALEEAADLVGPNHEWSQQSVLQQKVLSHKTRLISPNDIGNISRTQALDYYCGFAQSQIELAIGHSAAGSASLYTLGKIEMRSSVNKRRGDWTGQARALVFFRAAMSCNPANAACSNELGVLLHDMGRLEEAEHALKASLTSSPTRSAWGNLASVHNQRAINAKVIGERSKHLHFAKLAAMRAEQSGNNVIGNGEQWATPSEFHNKAAFPNITMQPVSQNRQQTSNQNNVSTVETLMQKVKGW